AQARHAVAPRRRVLARSARQVLRAAPAARARRRGLALARGRRVSLCLRRRVAHGARRRGRAARDRASPRRPRPRRRQRLAVEPDARAPLSTGHRLVDDGTPRVDLSAPLAELHSNERLQHESRFLRGTLVDSLADPATGAVDPDDALLTKFFGIYQQDDRDLRDERRRAKLEPRYQFMVRVRLPGGVCTPQQWLALDELTRECADGTLRLTTRQTFQFHGIRKHNLRRHIQGL